MIDATIALIVIFGVLAMIALPITLLVKAEEREIDQREARRAQAKGKIVSPVEERPYVLHLEAKRQQLSVDRSLAVDAGEWAKVKDIDAMISNVDDALLDYDLGL